MEVKERRGVDEAYASAMSSSNLKVDSESKGDADVLIAAGWSRSRVGAALIRLHSEWDGAARARVLVAADLERATKPEHAGQERARAKAEAQAANEQEARMLFAKLKTLPGVQEHLAGQFARWGVAEPVESAGAMARWWLQRRCQICGGTGFSRKLGKACRHCVAGEIHPPLGDLGKRAAIYMDDCVHRARKSIGRALRSTMDHD